MEYGLDTVELGGADRAHRRPERRVEAGRGSVESPSVEPTRASPDALLVAAGALHALIGVWVLISPFFIDYGNAGVDLNPVLSGAVLAALGLIRLTGSYVSLAISALAALVGLWMILSGFALTDDVTATWNLAAFGAIAVVLSFIAEAAAAEAVPRSRS